MDESDARIQILLSGLHDWVSLDEARHLVRRASPAEASPADVRLASLEAIDDLLGRGLVVVGDLANGFAPWSGSREEIVNRIASQWTNLDHAEWLGIGWLANTPAGNALARPVWETLPDPSGD